MPPYAVGSRSDTWISDSAREEIRCERRRCLRMSQSTNFRRSSCPSLDVLDGSTSCRRADREGKQTSGLGQQERRRVGANTEYDGPCPF